MTGVIALVAAVDRHGAIGKDGQLPWHLPDDLKRFKRLTLGHAVLMGRRTAQSIGRALPGRANLVLTRSRHAPYGDQTAVSSLDAALEHAQGGPLYVIGGGEVYALTLPCATHLLMTHVDTVVQGADAFFPACDERDWQVTAREHHPADDRHRFAFEFADYSRAGSPGV
jgi:dihydrofolate reductase